MQKITKNCLNKTFKQMLKEFWYAPMDAYMRSFEVCIWRKINFTSPVLDIGIGDGRVDRHLFRGKKIDVGIDINPKLIGIAKKEGLCKRVICANVEKMPFKKPLFNTIAVNSTFEHIKNDLIALREIKRVAKKGACLYFTVPNKNFKKSLLKFSLFKKCFRKINTRIYHLHYRDLPEWKKFLQNEGFKVMGYIEYFSEANLLIWYILFKIFTFKFFGKEIWSYLKDSKISKILPKKFIYHVEYLLLSNLISINIGNSCLMFIYAKKI